MDAAKAPRPAPVAGVHTAAREIHAAVAAGVETIATAHFPLSCDGLGALSAWLRQLGVTKVALLQGSLAWPWQYKKALQLTSKGPIDLAAWIEYQGEDALFRVEPQAAWQPVMLALRNDFAVFPVKCIANGGDHPVPVNRDTARNLASMLEAGDFIVQYPKQSLQQVIDAMEHSDAALHEALAFFLAESRGHWHNRARAKIARHLKHCRLDAAACADLVRTIARRLIDGNFTEQFADQL